jgi:hypothetical protein
MRKGELCLTLLLSSLTAVATATAADLLSRPTLAEPVVTCFAVRNESLQGGTVRLHLTNSGARPLWLVVQSLGETIANEPPGVLGRTVEPGSATELALPSRPSLTTKIIASGLFTVDAELVSDGGEARPGRLIPCRLAVQAGLSSEAQVGIR